MLLAMMRRPIVAVWLSFAVGCHPEAEPDRPPSGIVPLANTAGDVNRPPDKPSGILPAFRMIGPESGLDFERYDDIRGQWRILEVNGGGVALFDPDRDGWLDVYLTNGCRLPLSLGDRGRQGELFRNRGALQFQRTTDPSRLIQFGQTHGCAVGDFDADGFDDLYLTAYGPNALWHNNGDGTFSEVAEATGTTAPSWGSSAAFADVNRDGCLDLYVVNYLQESDEFPTLCPNPQSPTGYASCQPSQFEGVDDVLFLGDGAGRFIDATAAAGISGLRGKGLGVVISDLDGDAWPEIYVANDGEANFLLVARADDEGREDVRERENHGGEIDGSSLPPIIRLEERGMASGVALNENGYAQASMGVAVGDFDGDGRPDLFLTHFYDDTNTLYGNRGELAFEDVTRSSRLGPPSRTKLGWGTAFADVDNDGWLDLLVANGHVDDRTWSSHSEPYAMRAQLFRNERDGTFRDVSEWAGAYFQGEWVGRGLAVGDLDRDGRIDAVVSHQLAGAGVLGNDTRPLQHSATIRFVGTHSVRNGYGVVVQLGTQAPRVRRELIGGGSFQSASAGEVHLGLGASERTSIEVRWPSGHREDRADLAPGEWIAVERGGWLHAAPH